MNDVEKLKNLMVSACEVIRDGHKDIALNLMEIACDVMKNVKPEEIETQFITATSEPTEELESLEEETFVEEEEPEAENASHGSSLNSILDNWKW